MMAVTICSDSAVTICSDFGALKNKACYCFHCGKQWKWTIEQDKPKTQEIIKACESLLLVWDPFSIIQEQFTCLGWEPPSMWCSCDWPGNMGPRLVHWWSHWRNFLPLGWLWWQSGQRDPQTAYGSLWPLSHHMNEGEQSRERQVSNSITSLLDTSVPKAGFAPLDSSVT